MPTEEWLRERRRAHKLAHRLTRFLKESWEWEIRFMPLGSDIAVCRRLGFGRLLVGAYVPDKHLIAIDPSYEDFFSVLIHECLHAIYPLMEEDGVLALETIVRRHMTMRQARSLLIWAANRLR